MKEKIGHRKPWDMGPGPRLAPETVEAWYEFHLNRDYITKDDNGEVVAICSDKKRLRRFTALQKSKL